MVSQACSPPRSTPGAANGGWCARASPGWSGLSCPCPWMLVLRVLFFPDPDLHLGLGPGHPCQRFCRQWLGTPHLAPCASADSGCHHDQGRLRGLCLDGDHDAPGLGYSRRLRGQEAAPAGAPTSPRVRATAASTPEHGPTKHVGKISGCRVAANRPVGRPWRHVSPRPS